MSVDAVADKIRGWMSEFTDLSDLLPNHPDYTDRLSLYLARRLEEAGDLFCTSGTIRVRLADNSVKRVIVDGVGHGGLIACRPTSGMGFYCIPVDWVLAEDRGTLTDILNQLVSDGKLKG